MPCGRFELMTIWLGSGRCLVTSQSNFFPIPAVARGAVNGRVCEERYFVLNGQGILSTPPAKLVSITSGRVAKFATHRGSYRDGSRHGGQTRTLINSAVPSDPDVVDAFRTQTSCLGNESPL